MKPSILNYLSSHPSSDVSVDELIQALEARGLGWSLDNTGRLIEARVWDWPHVIGRYRPNSVEPLVKMLAEAMYQVDWTKFPIRDRDAIAYARNPHPTGRLIIPPPPPVNPFPTMSDNDLCYDCGKLKDWDCDCNPVSVTLHLAGRFTVTPYPQRTVSLVAAQAAIAELCGWKFKKGGAFWNGWRPDGSRCVGKFPSKLGAVSCLCPDYFGDLNAVHGAEKGLTPEQWISYWSFLEPLACQNNQPIIFATAPQRARALLLVFNITIRDE